MGEGKALIEMQYLFGKKENYEDYTSGRVPYNAESVPNFPVRLQKEELSVEVMMEKLFDMSAVGTILAVCVNKEQRIECTKWIQLEK